ncbi:hypothetical protein [Cellulosilyticum sp. I15G10I2]|uniref:hypothetical protein n=1 Tax=Cellulosilyticum sp. I15G10I2 TaxID=1892843 RepID=UPI00085CE009|nr:hypothetical protein [Cellulosilyticum sp. I15G10I2]
MKKPFRIFITLILLVSIISVHSDAYSQPYMISPTLQTYVDRADVLLNQIYYLGQTALANSINQLDNNETLRLIGLNLAQVTTLERDVIGYIGSLSPNTMEARNATILHIALHHFNMALGELGFFIRASTDIDRFNALQRYFYDIITAIENINQVKQQVLT